MTRFTVVKKRPCSCCVLPIRMAEIAGVKVRALKAEMATENAMVSANWRKRMPVLPGKKATGTNTATSTSEVAMTAPATSFMATVVARRGSCMPSRR